MTRTTRRFLIAAAAFLIVGLGGGLIAYLAYSRANLPAGVPLEVRFVPADAALVAFANVRSIIASDFHRELRPTVETPSQKGRQLMSDLAGIDFEKQVDHVVAYVHRLSPEDRRSDSLPTRRAPRAVMLVQGDFDQARIEQFIRDQGGTIADHNGRHISVRRENGEETAIGFVRSDLLAVGSADLVRRTLDVPEGSSGGATDLTANEELMSLLRDAAGSTVWVAGDFDAVTEGMGLPSAVTRKVPPIRLLSAKANINGGVKATVRAETADQPSAEQLRDMIRGFMAVAKFQTGGNPELENAIKSMQLSSTDRTVQLQFAVTADTLRVLGRGHSPIVPPPPPRQVK